MPMDVKMPDGTIVKNVPDGMTKTTLMARYQKFSAGPAETPSAMQQPQTPPKPAINTPNSVQQPRPITQQPQQQGFIQDFAGDVSKGVTKFKDVVGRVNEQNPVSTGLQGLGAIGGAIGDIGADVAKAAYRAAPDIGGFKEKISGGIDKAMSSSFGKAAIEAAKRGGLAYMDFAKSHPEAARNVEALVDIATFFPAAKAGKAAVKAAGEVTAISPITKGLASPSEEKMKTITDALHKKATATIEAAKNSGISYSPEHAQGLVEDLGKIGQLATAGERTGESKTVELLDQLKESVLGPPMKDKKGRVLKDSSGEVVRDSSKADTSLRNLHGFSKTLGEIRDESSALSAKKIIDSAIGDTKSIVTGNPKNSALIPQFKKEWGRFKTGEDIAAATALAGESAAKSRKAFQKIVDSDYFKSLSPEVQKLTKLAAKGKASGKFMDAVGSLKVLVGGRIPVAGKHLPAFEAVSLLASGHPVPAAIIGGVMGAGASGKQIQRGVGADVLKAIQKEK